MSISVEWPQLEEKNDFLRGFGRNTPTSRVGSFQPISISQQVTNMHSQHPWLFGPGFPVGRSLNEEVKRSHDTCEYNIDCFLQKQQILCYSHLKLKSTCLKNYVIQFLVKIPVVRYHFEENFEKLFFLNLEFFIILNELK